MLLLRGPWAPFLLAVGTRICAGLAFLLLLESQVLGLAPPLFRSLAFYGAAAFVGSAFIQHLFGSVAGGPTPDLAVTAEVGTLRSDAVAFAACAMRGWRPSMEDAHVMEMLEASVFPDVALFAVLDGHGGKEVSALASSLLAEEIVASGREALQLRATAGEEGAAGPSVLEAALEVALPRLDERLRFGPFGMARTIPTMLHPFSACGSTACLAAVDFTTREVIVSNIGDSRALLVRNGKAIELSEDHKPENPKERSRIRAAGGQVLRMGPCHRVDGNLNLSRALGDFHLKANFTLPADKQKVIAYPDITRTPFQGGSQELLVVACDGLFERCTNQGVADIIWPRLRSGMALEQIGRELLHACCARSCHGRPIEEGTDNETVILVKLPPRPDAAEVAGTAEGAKATEATAKCGTLRPGQRVSVHGLESEAGQRLNGQMGIVEALDSEGSGRCEVRLLQSGGVKSLKAANLTPDDANSGSS